MAGVWGSDPQKTWTKPKRRPKPRRGEGLLEVEVPGIEPGSSGVSTGLLRAQSATSLLGSFSHANKLK